MRILLNPDPNASGGAVVNPVVQQQPPAAVVEPPKVATISIPAEEAIRLYDSARRLQDLDAKTKADLEAKETEKLLALAQKGEVEKAFTTFKERETGRYAALEAEYLGANRDRVVADALVGKAFISEFAASQAKQILAARIEAVRDPSSGSLIVRDKITGRPAAEVLKEALASPEFAHFLPAENKGGAGSGGGNRTTQTPNPAEQTQQPANLGDLALQNFQARQQEFASRGNVPFGIGRNRMRPAVN